MSVMILHGDHHVRSRAKLVELIAAAKKRGLEVKRLESTGLSAAVLEAELGSQDMFGTQKAIVIEGIFGGPKSKKKDELLNLVARFEQENEIILWEGKKLTAAQEKKFPKAKKELFNLSSALFEWLASIHTTGTRKLILLKQALAQDGADFCFAMLARQVRLLLTIKSGESIAGHPFMVKKLHQQAKTFSEQQLINLHEELTYLDFHYKTGQLKLSLEQSLEQLMIQ